jgi:hypothetical protein
MSRPRPGLPALLLGLLLAGAAAAAGDDGAIRVGDAAGLAAALAGATGGETIRLAPGDYGRLTLDGQGGGFAYDRPVTVTSEDPAAPAVFTGLDVRNAANLTFRTLTFDYVAREGDSTKITPFRIADSRNIAVIGSVFDGDVARGGDPAGRGYPAGRAFQSADNTGFDFLGNTVHTFWKGLGIGRSTDVRVIGNDFHGLRSDGMNVNAPQGILIEGNHFHDFVRAPDTGDHADMIQFWTTNTTRPGTDITIRGNLMQAGEGGQTQSIFLRNELVDKGQAGPEMFYRRITIEDNVILNGHLNGITVGATDGLVIRGNTILRDPALVRRGERTDDRHVPRIRISKIATGVTVADNIAPALPEARPGWQVTGNLRAQDTWPTRPGHYADLFVERPAGGAEGLAARVPLKVRPGGPADRPGLGSSLMR